MNIPDGISPAAMASKYGFSERRVREKARELGACRILGKAMTLLPEDVHTILEALKCPRLPSISVTGSGTIAAPSPRGDYAALRASRKPKKTLRRERLPSSKTDSGNVITMV